MHRSARLLIRHISSMKMLKKSSKSGTTLTAVAATHKELCDLMKEAVKRSEENEEIDEDLHFDTAKAEVSAELYYS